MSGPIGRPTLRGREMERALIDEFGGPTPTWRRLLGLEVDLTSRAEVRSEALWSAVPDEPPSAAEIRELVRSCGPGRPPVARVVVDTLETAREVFGAASAPADGAGVGLGDVLGVPVAVSRFLPPGTVVAVDTEGRGLAVAHRTMVQTPN